LFSGRGTAKDAKDAKAGDFKLLLQRRHDEHDEVTKRLGEGIPLGLYRFNVLCLI
jgi:hypothetical protein